MIRQTGIFAIGLVLLLSEIGAVPAHAFTAKKPESASAPSTSLVWVTRKDGATSCGVTQPQSLEEGAAELQKNGIKVLASRKGNDGKMHAQSCGMSTGSLNMYQISRDDLAKALTLGFIEQTAETIPQ